MLIQITNYTITLMHITYYTIMFIHTTYYTLMLIQIHIYSLMHNIDIFSTNTSEQNAKITNNLRFGLFHGLKIYPKAEYYIVLEEDLILAQDFYR